MKKYVTYKNFQLLSLLISLWLGILAIFILTSVHILLRQSALTALKSLGSFALLIGCFLIGLAILFLFMYYILWMQLIKQKQTSKAMYIVAFVVYTFFLIAVVLNIPALFILQDPFSFIRSDAQKLALYLQTFQIATILAIAFGLYQAALLYHEKKALTLREIMKPNRVHETTDERNTKQEELTTMHTNAQKQKRKQKKYWILLIVIALSIFGIKGYMSQQKSIDPFEHIRIHFEGIDGTGSATIEIIPTYLSDKQMQFLHTLTFVVERDGQLWNGDSAIIRVEYSKIMEKQYKLSLSKVKSSVEVTGLSRHIASYKDLTTEEKSKILNSYEDFTISFLDGELKEYVKNLKLFEANSQIIQHEVIMKYFCTSTLNEYNNNPSIYYIMKVEVKNEEVSKIIYVSIVCSNINVDILPEYNTDYVYVEAYLTMEDESVQHLALRKLQQFHSNSKFEEIEE